MEGRPQRKVGKRKRLQPPTFKWVPWLGGAGGAINASHLGPLGSVTQPSSAPTPHCVRRGWVHQGNHRIRLRMSGGRRLRLGDAPKLAGRFESAEVDKVMPLRTAAQRSVNRERQKKEVVW